MQIDFIFTGKTSNRYIADGISDFEKRIQRFSPVKIKISREQKGKISDEQIIREEGISLLEHIDPKSYTVALDRAGKHLSSEGLAEVINNWQNQGRRNISFIIGGHLGLSDAVLNAADYTLSLSKMTFTHEMARLILMEQIYRAFSILAGSKYHK